MIFEMIVTRDTTESCIFTVDAEDENEARDKALERARQDKTLPWEQDDTPNASKSPYVTNCEPED